MLRTLLPFLITLPALAYCLISLVCARRYFRAPRQMRCSAPPAVSILKPVKGMDQESYQNFASFCRQEYAGQVQLLFALASPEDPAAVVIRHLMADFPDRDICLTVNPAIHGPNYKVSNLINAFPQAKHDIIIVCDSDIRVSPTIWPRSPPTSATPESAWSAPCTAPPWCTASPPPWKQPASRPR